MIRRALLISFALVALLAAPAAGQTDYDGTQADAEVQADGDIVVSAEGFIPNSEVSWQVDFEPFDGENAAAPASFAGGEGEYAFALASAAAPAEIVQTGTTQADANGEVLFEVEGQGEGRYTITMTDGVNTAVASVTVGEPGADTGATTAGAGNLPTTGSSNSIGLTQLGILFVIVGGVAIYVAKRRRSNSFA